MKRTTRLRLGISTAIFFIAAVAGWHGVSAVPVAPGTSLPVLSAKLPAAATVENAAGEPTLLGAENDAVMKLEQQLLRTIDPIALSHNGERLMELCFEEFPQDLPITPSAFSYALEWAKQDPQGMFAWFQRRGGFTLPALNGNYGFDNHIFLELTKKNPDAAITAALSCPTKRDCAEALIHVIEQLRKTDPVRATSLASEHLAKLETTHGWNAYGKDYRETWDFLTALTAGKSRGKVIAGYFEEVIRYHSKDSGQLWKDMPDALRREIVAGGFSGTYLPRLGSTEQLEGISGLQREHIESTGDAMTTRQWLGTGAREWAGRDPAAAVAWALQNLKGQQRLEGTAQLFSAGAAQDFAATLRVWQSLPDGILKAHATGHLAAGAPEARKAETEALLESLPPTDRAIANTAKKAAEAAERQRKNRLEELRNPAQG